jgi:hypothetical protein
MTILSKRNILVTLRYEDKNIKYYLSIINTWEMENLIISKYLLLP